MSLPDGSSLPEPDYKLQLQNFSLIGKVMEKYKSAVFEAGGYKWRLVVYPNGNKSMNVTDNISLYLASADPVKLGFEVRAVFHLYLFHHGNKPSDIEVVIKGSFNLLKHECGSDKFVDHKKFRDVYLKEDGCIFGVKVDSVCEARTTGRGESLSMLKKGPITHRWKIEEFSTKRKEERVASQVFTVGKHNWKIQLYPRGKGIENSEYISLYLALADPTSTASVSCSYKTYAEVTLRILDQSRHRHIRATDKFWFSPWNPDHGWSKFISLAEFEKLKNGLVVGDTCFLEAEIDIVAKTEVL